MSSVAAIIPNWNTSQYLERCLVSLAGQIGVEIETLVVDNGSTDSSVDLIDRREQRYLALSENVGFARAVNLGVADTRSPLILVVNADCFLLPDCLRLLVEALSADDRIGGVQPRILQQTTDDEPPIIYSTGQCLTRNGVAFERGWGQRDGLSFATGTEVFGVSGAACLLRRQLFTDLGGYDESYFAFFEDVDFNARSRLAGWRFAYVPEAYALHVGHAAWGQQRRAHAFNVELTVRNRLATALKLLPVRTVVRALVLTVRSVAAGAFRGTGKAALAGAITALRWLPRLLVERRRLRRGSSRLLDPWLVQTPERGPDPRDVGASSRQRRER